MLKTLDSSPVNSCVVTHVPFCVNADIGQHQSIKFVKGVFCLDKLNPIQTVTNVPIVSPDLPVGARLHNFWENGQPWGSV